MTARATGIKLWRLLSERLISFEHWLYSSQFECILEHHKTFYSLCVNCDASLDYFLILEVFGREFIEWPQTVLTCWPIELERFGDLTNVKLCWFFCSTFHKCFFLEWEARNIYSKCLKQNGHFRWESCLVMHSAWSCRWTVECFWWHHPCCGWQGYCAELGWHDTYLLIRGLRSILWRLWLCVSWCRDILRAWLRPSVRTLTLHCNLLVAFWPM